MLTAGKVQPFWINVFQAYEDLSDRVDLNISSELLIEPLFLKNKFKIDNKKKVLHFRKWTSKNIFFVKDLLKGLMFKDSIKNTILEFNFQSILDVLMLLELI